MTTTAPTATRGDVVLEAMRRLGSDPVHRSKLSDETGLSLTQVSNGLQSLISRTPAPIRRVGEGVYEIVPEGEIAPTVPRTRTRKKAAAKKKATATAKAATTRAAKPTGNSDSASYRLIGTDGAGRNVLENPDGQLYVAIPLVPRDTPPT